MKMRVVNETQELLLETEAEWQMFLDELRNQGHPNAANELEANGWARVVVKNGYGRPVIRTWSAVEVIA